MTSISRRETMALTGAGLMAALTASAVTASAALAASPIRILFEEWEQVTALMHDANHFAPLDRADDDAEMSRLCARQHELMLQMVKLPCRDPGDFAMKVIAVTGDGDFPLDQFAEPILADARAVIAQAA